MRAEEASSCRCAVVGGGCSRQWPCLVLLASVSAAPAQSPERLWQEKADAAPPADIARLNDFLHNLAERLKPFLVQVRVSRAVESPAEGEGGTPEERRASGSGFLIRQDGYLVTNAHVVTEAERIQVKLSDGRRFEGRLVGQDDRVDLALVKIEATGLPVADLGDSNRLRVGELVLALGHPFGLEQTVSFGIVSRKGAPLDVAAPGFDFIQTDAAINPGNSGGPLVSMAGEVIGVNSMAARNGSIGFAIPINLVKGLLPQLAEKGKVEWGWLGVSIAEVADEDVARYRLKEPRGVLVRQVVAGQPADKGGVKANDVILGVDGARVNEPRDLQRIISSTPVGKSVKLSMMREGQETEVSVVVGLYEAGPTRPRRQPVPDRQPVPRSAERSPARPLAGGGRMISRRVFVGTLGLAALAAPVRAEAQRAARQSRIAFLGAESPSTSQQFLAAFREGLRARGYVEGRDVVVEAFWAEGRGDRFPDLVAEILRQKPDVLVVMSTPAGLAAKKATATVPIVFVAADPSGTGLVPSLSRPGGNVTGVSLSLGVEFTGKWLELLREAVPRGVARWPSSGIPTIRRMSST